MCTVEAVPMSINQAGLIVEGVIDRSTGVLAAGCEMPGLRFLGLETLFFAAIELGSRGRDVFE